MGEGGAWAVLYTAQLTQKHKRWHDGILRQQGGKLLLFSDAKRCIDQLHAPSVEVGAELKSEKHLIMVEAREDSAPPPQPPAAASRGPRKAIRKPKARRTLGLRSGKSRSSSSPAPLPEPAPRPTFSYAHSAAQAPAPPAPVAARRSVSFAVDRREDGARGGAGAGREEEGRDARLVTFMPLGGRPVPRLFLPPGGRSAQQLLALLEQC